MASYVMWTIFCQKKKKDVGKVWQKNKFIEQKQVWHKETGYFSDMIYSCWYLVLTPIQTLNSSAYEVNLYV